MSFRLRGFGVVMGGGGKRDREGRKEGSRKDEAQESLGGREVACSSPASADSFRARP